MSTAGRLALVLVVFALLAGSAVWRHVPGRGPRGEAAPGFDLPRLSGGRLQLASLRGQVVLVNFWATWCAPCVAEMPSLQKLHEALGAHGLAVVGISIDEERGELERFVRDHGLTFPVLHDASGAVASAWGVQGYPETFVLDAAGGLREHYRGPAVWHGPDALDHFRERIGIEEY
jgi:peroxiredoxin